MEKGRLEAFSDGVIAIIITIMVLELKVPHGDTWQALDSDLMSKFASYVMSFVYVGIYWNNHHHLLKSAERVSGRILWMNLLLLFWLSLVPFAAAWTGESKFAAAPTAVYGIVLLLSAISYWLLQKAIIAEHGHDSLLARALGRDLKGNLSPFVYLTAIGLSFWCPIVSNLLYLFVALLWLVPDKRIERVLRESK
jgi:uncharacterized membrane protein